MKMIPQEQYDLPIGFDAVTDVALTLREYEKTRPLLAELTDDRLYELTKLRIGQLEKFDLVVGFQPISQSRAIAELEAKSKIGSVLIDIERRTINYVLAEL